MKKKRIIFGLLGFMICIILFALYLQLQIKAIFLSKLPPFISKKTASILSIPTLS